MNENLTLDLKVGSRREVAVLDVTLEYDGRG